MAGADSDIIVTRWREVLSGCVQDEGIRRAARAVALTFAQLALIQPTWDRGLREEGDMGESNVFNEMRKEWGDRTRLETTRHHVLALLEGRFPGQAPEDVRRLIAQVDSQETLDRWFLALARAKDYGDFDAALRK